jgi:hypothetical protein
MNKRLVQLLGLIVGVYIVMTGDVIGQNSVGIGTANSNEQAVLELVSPLKNYRFITL